MACFVLVPLPFSFPLLLSHLSPSFLLPSLPSLSISLNPLATHSLDFSLSLNSQLFLLSRLPSLTTSLLLYLHLSPLPKVPPFLSIFCFSFPHPHASLSSFRFSPFFSLVLYALLLSPFPVCFSLEHSHTHTQAVVTRLNISK